MALVRCKYCNTQISTMLIQCYHCKKEINSNDYEEHQKQEEKFCDINRSSIYCYGLFTGAIIGISFSILIMLLYFTFFSC